MFLLYYPKDLLFSCLTKERRKTLDKKMLIGTYI